MVQDRPERLITSAPEPEVLYLPLMIEAATRVLKEKGLHQNDIFYDEF